MYRCKRMIAFMMAVCLMAGFFVPGKNEAKAAVVPVISWDNTVAGDYLVLQLSGRNFSDIMQLELTVTYDDSLLSLASYDDMALTKLMDGVHPDVKEDRGKVTFSVFVNDGLLTFRNSELLALTFQTDYTGQRDLSFELEVTECRKNTSGSEAEVPVQYDSSYSIPNVGDGAADSYDCGLIGIGSVQAGMDADVAFYFYKSAGISSGSFEIVYNPAELKYKNCTTYEENVQMKETVKAPSRVQVGFSMKNGDAMAVGGEFLHLHFIPLKNDCTTNVRMENLQLKGDAGNPVEIKANTSVFLTVMDDGSVNRFTLAAPQQIFGTKEFEVSLGINNNEGFNIMDGFLTYNSDLLEFVGGAFSQEFGSGFQPVIEEKSAGRLQIQNMFLSPVKNNGTVAVLRFRPRKSVEAYTDLHFAIADEKEDSFVQLPEGAEKRHLTSIPGSCAVRLLEPCKAHTWDKGTVTKKATYTSAGIIKYTCTRCGDTMTRTTSMLALAKVKLASVENTSEGISVKWKTTAGASGYQVYRKMGNDSYKKLATVDKPTAASYVDKTVKSGKTYTYQIRAYNSAQTGKAQNALKNKYLGAVSVTSASNGKSGVSLKWSRVMGATGYRIYRKMGSGSYKKLTTIKKNIGSYTDKSAKNTVAYTYKVAAYSGSYTGASKGAKALVRMAAPSISAVQSKGAGTLTVKCRKDTSAAGYEIQVSASSGFKKDVRSARVSSRKAVSKKFTKLSKGKKYYVRVRTYKKSGKTTYYSAWSSVKSKKTAK